MILVWEQVYIHVYKLKDSELGFYHTGIEMFGMEFTYCHDKGIVRHKVSFNFMSQLLIILIFSQENVSGVIFLEQFVLVISV